jgi:hypothetical protein
MFGKDCELLDFLLEVTGEDEGLKRLENKFFIILQSINQIVFKVWVD